MEGQTTTDNKRKLWYFPWQYKESLLISVVMMLAGFIIEIATGSHGISFPGWPSNLFMLLMFIAYIAAFHLIVKHPVKTWLSSMPAAIASISTFSLLILLMGFIPQESENLWLVNVTGLSHIVRSWSFQLCGFNLLFVLSFTIIRRLLPLSFRNIAFTLSHLGLWIVIVSATLGSGDSMKLGMMLTEKKVTSIAFDNEGQAYDIRFGIELLKFSIDEYPPELGLVRPSTGKLLHPNDKLIEIYKGNKAMIGNLKMEIIEYFETAQKNSLGFYRSDVFGSAPAALVAVTDAHGTKQTGWVTSGSAYVYPVILLISDSEAIAMTMPRPKKFNSLVRIHADAGDSGDFTIGVNNPLKFKGWTIYQSGYDVQMGKWSKRSMLQLVRDPWLPAVYTGIFMILAGALYLLISRKTKNSIKKQTS